MNHPRTPLYRIRHRITGLYRIASIGKCKSYWTEETDTKRGHFWTLRNLKNFIVANQNWNKRESSKEDLDNWEAVEYIGNKWTFTIEEILVD